MAKKPQGERLASVPSQPTNEIDEEILGSIAHLDDQGSGGENDGDEDDTPNAPMPTRPVIPASQAKKVGAVNAEAVQQNRRRRGVIEKKRDGEKSVPWGESDACLLYDDIISLWPPASLLSHVTRITGSRTSWYLRAQPRNGMELHEAIKTQCHGRSPETEYQVVFRDSAGREERGRGRITLPSTEYDTTGPGLGLGQPHGQQPPMMQQPMQAPPQAPPPQEPPPPPPQQRYAQPMRDPDYPPPRRRWPADEEDLYPRPPAAQAPPPQQQSADPVVVMNLQQQLSDIKNHLRGLDRAASDPVAQQLASIQAQLDKMQTQDRAPAPAVAAPVPVATPAPAPPAAVKAPEVPPGYALTMMNGMAVLVPLSSLGLAGPPAAAPAPPVAAAPAAPVAPPAPPPTPMEQFTSAVATVRGAVEAAQAIQNILPQALPAAQAASAPIETPDAEEPSPTKTVKYGDVNVIQNTDDGSLRLVDTAIANAPAILSWVDKQRTEMLARQEAARTGQALPAAPQQGPMGAPHIPGR